MCCICFWIGVPAPEGMDDDQTGEARTIIGGHAVCETHAGYFQTPELAFFIQKHRESQS
jgi:hypothetical protein